MAGDIIPTPANGAADWSDFPVQVEKQRAGFQAISLTHFDDALEPEIAAGSIKEIGSAIAKFDINEPITGWGAIGNDNDVYIKLVPAPPIVTAEFTTDVPVWSHTKQGWYGVGGAATHVYVGGLYKDAGGDYTAKYLWGKWHENNANIKIFADGSIVTDGNIDIAGQVSATRGFKKSGTLIGTDITENQVFDALKGAIPNAGDTVLLNGSWWRKVIGDQEDLGIVSYGDRVDADTIRIYYQQFNVPLLAGAPNNASSTMDDGDAGLAFTGGLGTDNKVNLAW